MDNLFTLIKDRLDLKWDWILLKGPTVHLMYCHKEKIVIFAYGTLH